MQDEERNEETGTEDTLAPEIKTYKVLKPLEYNGGQYPEGAHIQLTPDDANAVEGGYLEEVTAEEAVQPDAAPPTPIEGGETTEDALRTEEESQAEEEEKAEASTSDDNAPTSDAGSES